MTLFFKPFEKNKNLNLNEFIEKSILEKVKNKSFVDVGAIWTVFNEKVSVAHKGGASSLTVIDKFDFSEIYWENFHKRMKSFNIENCSCISCNVLDYDGPKFDVVYCGGVLYHAPDPLLIIKKLRSITKERLVITSTVTPKVLTNEHGTFSLPDGGIVFVPALSKQNKMILSKHWNQFLGGRPDGGLVNDFVWDANSFQPWWWLFTPEVLLAMYVSCGFKIDGCHQKNDLFSVSLS
jgi:hypothetical protein